MNSRFTPDASAVPIAGGGMPSGEAAIVTPSFAGDFERCRLLCETMDRYVAGYRRHYLLVAHSDVKRFRALEGSRRIVVDERDLLPGWLHDLPDPASLFRRRIWLSMRTAPLRGWHVQQLRRIALAGHVEEDVLIYCDSDVVFLKAFDCARFRRGDDVRLYRREGALGSAGAEHQAWWRHAGRTLGLREEAGAMHDYITTLIAWRRTTVIEMIRHVEALHGRSWVEVIAAGRRFSECLIYGRFVDEVLHGAGHFHDATEYCRVYWSGPQLSEAGIADFAAGLADDQVAVGMQSFIGTDVATVRRALSS